MRLKSSKSALKKKKTHHTDKPARMQLCLFHVTTKSGKKYVFNGIIITVISTINEKFMSVV